MHSRSAFDAVVCSLPGAPDPALPIAGSRAGAIGVLNLEFVVDPILAIAAIDRLATFGRGRLGVLLDADDSELRSTVLATLPESIEFVCIAARSPEAVAPAVADVLAARRRAFVVATSEEIGRAAEVAGAEAVIAKGHEAGGWIGEESSFVLLQRLIGRLRLPVWAWGGVGLHTAAACFAGGAAGVVLDSQLALTRESPLGKAARQRIRSMDGSETASLGGDLGAQFRVYVRPGIAAVDDLRAAATAIAVAEDRTQKLERWRSELLRAVGWSDPDRQALAIGQDAVFAAHLADRFVTVGGVVGAIQAGAIDHARAAQLESPLVEGSSLSISHGTRYPIVQGPMTRVSDRAEFAAAVASAGALPFLALALMRADEVETLLDETARLLADRPWGVGVLGFVPAALRAEQLEVIRRYRPPFALIAGGRPDQARSLEADGIATYLHVPSPGLLTLYLADGARRFVFEGRECGGHVGPRTSFVLWDTMVRGLLADFPAKADPTEVHVLFAGGIHDAQSAAMVAAIAAPLVARGMRVGVLLGTAYLFTEEAVASTAITPGFQSAAVSCVDTVLLESGPGHATRCLPTPFADDFIGERLALLQTTASSEEIRNRLEELNIGRLRIASKGVDRHPDYGRDPAAPKLIEVDADEQRARGMYMIGQVAALRNEVISMATLHANVSFGSAEALRQLALPDGRAEAAQPPAQIAIVGMGSILPGASDSATFWANIVDKVDAVTEIPASRWDWRQYYDPDRSAPDKIYSKWGGFIDDVPFDPVEFGMPPRSLQSIEPFQLLGLLVVKAALADAGYATRPFNRERTSVVLGAGGGGADLTAGYMVRSTLPLLFGESASEVNRNADGLLPEWTEDSFPGLLMNVASGRIANRFDFGGANFTVDAACASSLAAVYLAIRDLQTGNSDMAIVGGVDAIQNPFSYLCFSKTQALSPTGRCRPFDADADGIAISEGFAALVLKRLSDAERDGDRVYAVIQGVGAASDGRDRSMTAPRPEGQMRALDRAYAHAGYSPATVGLFEAHGTGTVAGDQAEVQALTTVLERAGAGTQESALGSIKSMIGHTKATAGVAGLMKASLALHHRVLPATLGVTRPNPKADFPHSPLYVNSETRPWIRPTSHPRRAGVSAFGFGGTDFHLALEEYDGDFLAGSPAMIGRIPAELLIWRAASRVELLASVDGLLAQLEAGTEPSLADLAYSLSVGDNTHRGTALAIVAESIADLVAKLRTARGVVVGELSRQHLPVGIHFADGGFATDHQVAFVFPGQGSQYANMGRDVAVAFPDVRESLDRADDLLSDHFQQPLSHYIYPPPSFTPEEEKQQRAAITETNVAQPALGVVDAAIASLLATFGVTPQMTAGHSYGEFVALAAAGSITEEDMLRLSEARGRFMREGATGESGTMAAVDAPREALAPLLTDPDITLANLNSPKQTVISGGEASIGRAIEWCDAHSLRARRLPVACAFHSPYVAPAQGRLAEMLRQTPISPPRIPVYSNTTAGLYPDDPAAIASLLAEHLTHPVEWVAEIEAMYAAGARVFVEVGPRNVLTSLVGSILEGRPHLAVSVDQSGRPGVVQLLHCLAALVVEGVPVRLDRLFQSRPVTSVDMSALASSNRKPALSASTWFVNGSGARPASAPPRGAGRQPPLTVSLSRPSGETLQTGAPSDRSGHTNGLTTQISSTNGHFDANGSPPGPMTPRKGSTTMTATMQNGASAAHTDEPESPPIDRRDLPAILGSQPAPLAGPDRVSDVVNRHQQVMQQFLETQRSVMLAYLGAYRPAAESRVIEARATPRERIVELPPPAPVVAAPITNGHSHTDIPASVVTMAATPPTPPAATASVAPPAPPAAKAAPEPTAPPVAPVADTHDVLSRGQLLERLLTIVSDRTGYPPEMLSLDADLEADLGIDSIKRVEIAGTLMQTLPFPDGSTPDIERITSSKTLNQVVDALEDLLSPMDDGEPSLVAAKEDRRPFDHEPAGARIGRFMVQTHPVGVANRAGQLAPGGAIVLIDDRGEVGTRLAESLLADGYTAVRVDTRANAVDSADTASSLVASLRAEHGPAVALVHLATLARDRSIALSEPDLAAQELDHHLNAMFLISQALRSDLESAASRGGAMVLGVVAQGGALAIGGVPDGSFSGDGALSGFIKTIPQEWADVRAKVVDVETDDPGLAAQRVMDELFAADGLTEVGYKAGTRIGVTIAPAPITGREAVEPLDDDSIVLITGGARGITAEAALRLAERYRPTLVLVGRTPIEQEEPATASFSDERGLKQAIMDRQRAAGETPTAGSVEREYRRLIAQREVEENLARLRRAGSRVEYLSCDVRDAEAFRAVIDDIYLRHGRIDGVIHGAGIIEDKLIRDKQLDSFERVVSTKAHSAFSLAAALRPESLRFVTFFSSVSGRFGNRGQADYAAASEVLNKLAQELDGRWAAHVTSINWGPWLKTGMVSEGVQRQFAERGVEVIPLSVGCDRLIEELRFGRKGEVEVVVGGSRQPLGEGDSHDAITLPASDQPSGGQKLTRAALPLLSIKSDLTSLADGGVEIIRAFDPDVDLYLQDHRIDGAPVVPFAVALELIAEAAAVTVPQLPVAVVRDVRLLNGITVASPQLIRATARPRPDSTASRAIVDVTLSSTTSSRIHYRGTVELGEATRSLPVAGTPVGLEPFPMTVANAYRSYLFHGPLFHGVVSIDGISADGAVASIEPSTPSACLRGVSGASWIIDPVVVDSALQMQLLWTRLRWDMTPLPNELGTMSLFVPFAATADNSQSALRHELHIRPESRMPMCHADHAFYLNDGTLAGTITNMVGAGSRALNRVAVANE